MLIEGIVWCMVVFIELMGVMFGALMIQRISVLDNGI